MKIVFDDWVERYDDHERWTCICKACKEKYKIPDWYLDADGGGEICGVEGCMNKSDYYIDFPDGTTKDDLDWKLEFTFEEEAK